MSDKVEKFVYEDVIKVLDVGLKKQLAKNGDAFSDRNIILASEQAYIEKKEEFIKMENTIFIVVKFLEATPISGTFLLPVRISCISGQNDAQLTQNLLLDFAIENNRKRTEDGKMIQYYTTPEIMTNFLEIGYGYRSNVLMAASFQISDNVLEIVKTEILNDKNEYEIIDALSTVYTFSNAPDPQATYKNMGRTSTEIKTGTLIVNFATYSKVNYLATALRDIAFEIEDNKGINATFTFRFTFSDGTITKGLAMKVIENQTKQEIGDIPFCTYTLTR